MKDTAEIREKLLKLWGQFSLKRLSPEDARIHIGLARAVLETHKVEIAAAHLNLLTIPPVQASVSKNNVRKAIQ